MLSLENIRVVESIVLLIVLLGLAIVGLVRLQ